MVDIRSQVTRSFSIIELEQIKELKYRYLQSNCQTVEQWNFIRDEAKLIWPEKIISAVDGMRKWAIKYDKPSKTVTYLGIKF